MFIQGRRQCDLRSPFYKQNRRPSTYSSIWKMFLLTVQEAFRDKAKLDEIDIFKLNSRARWEEALIINFGVSETSPLRARLDLR